MFKIGDIVRPKKGFMGHNYCFKIIEVEMNPFDDNTYKLQGIKQDLDPLLGSTSYQVSIIDKVEELWWGEKHIELTSNVKLHYDTTSGLKADESLLNETFTTITLDANKLKKVKIKIDKINKEEKEMNILEIYKERKIKTLEKEFSEAKKAAIEEDEIQKIIIEMTNQVNTILENEDSDTRYESHPNLYTSKTEAKLNELNDKYHEQIEELRSTLDEIRALFELTDDYNERIKILKNYDILDKKGKLNV